MSKGRRAIFMFHLSRPQDKSDKRNLIERGILNEQECFGDINQPRRNGNSKLLADAFANGARQAGNSVENISLHDKTICFCKGCLSCQKSQRCVIHDDADTIAQKMRAADVLVFATPIYYYGMSGQMKTMLDRGNPLYASDYAFREVYLLAAAAEEEEHTMDGAVNGLRGWLACFPKARLAGTVFGGGVDVAGAIKEHPALQKAYEMGMAVSNG